MLNYFLLVLLDAVPSSCDKTPRLVEALLERIGGDDDDVATWARLKIVRRASVSKHHRSLASSPTLRCQIARDVCPAALEAALMSADNPALWIAAASATRAAAKAWSNNARDDIATTSFSCASVVMCFPHKMVRPKLGLERAR